MGLQAPLPGTDQIVLGASRSFVARITRFLALRQVIYDDHRKHGCIEIAVALTKQQACQDREKNLRVSGREPI
ncbi:hypothetical protein EF096_16820 [Pseudomonas neustonica]|uniref:Uncharacterized protein n=1 Tax=Pseudomonas neustonica TaxID=2487346 RepID=A0ABX9XE76_9PSED|nr:hypothetical protein [Pseudomonadales bacterium]ROZ80569.1 hypothetical protein EF099_17235 [Pseudomonas sp. SSM44]ROZ81746.1 hypothetical protein EF096_16820 [Pseudomonas neustonica]